MEIKVCSFSSKVKRGNALDHINKVKHHKQNTTLVSLWITKIQQIQFNEELDAIHMYVNPCEFVPTSAVQFTSVILIKAQCTRLKQNKSDR
jgi:hypothetical protein